MLLLPSHSTLPQKLSLFLLRFSLQHFPRLFISLPLPFLQDSSFLRINHSAVISNTPSSVPSEIFPNTQWKSNVRAWLRRVPGKCKPALGLKKWRDKFCKCDEATIGCFLTISSDLRKHPPRWFVASIYGHDRRLTPFKLNLQTWGKNAVRLLGED